MNVQDLTGQTVGQYHIRALLGMGGMGAVYLADQPTLKRKVALKVVLPSIVNHPTAVERFEREAQTAAALEHPHIVPIFDYGSVSGITYVAMRLLTGGSLQDRLDARSSTAQPLPALGEVGDILRQLGGALDYAHQNGVIHRDIKTSNVMFDDHGSAYLVDFGIAKLVDATSMLTTTGNNIGTPSYIAPEQWRGEPITAAADQYAMGVLVYKLLTGTLPFKADTMYALMNMHIEQMPSPPQSLRADLPTTLQPIIERAMAKQAQDRYPTMTAFADAFSKAIVGIGGQPTQFFSYALPQKPQVSPEWVSTSTTAPAVAPKRTPSPIAWFGGALTLLVLVAAAFLLSRGGAAITPTPTQTQIVAANAVQGASGLVVVPTVTLTPSPTPTQTDTASPTPSATRTPTSTITPTATLTPSLTPTVDAIAVAQATFAAIQTATATQWTQTPTATMSPTPNASETISAALTAFYNDSLTLTATLWTSTPTPTLTSTPSATPTPTPTLTPTATATPTATSTPTSLPTLPPLPISSEPSDDPLLAPLQNDDWIAQSQSFDGIDMVLVPIGCYTMGSDNGADNQRPAHQQCFRWPFWIDMTEVTNAQAGSSGGNLPRTDVTYFEAQAFCEARGGRLPTEAEWEYAARGPDSWVYPWGDRWNTRNLVYRDGVNDQPNPVGSRPAGASWVGALDMAGNVWEWTSSIHSPYPYNASDGREDIDDRSSSRVIKGGSWDFGNEEVSQAAWRGGEGYGLRQSDDGIGFRCVRDYLPSSAAPQDIGASAPSPTPPPTPTRIPAVADITCPDSMPSRLVIGSPARVTPGRANQRLRENPSLEAAQVAIIPAGSEIVVIDGPVCADGYAWWEVVYDGEIGWTAEGSDGEYWIEPLDTSVQTDDPTNAPIRVNFFMVAQTFERGYMFYLERFGEIWVLVDTGSRRYWRAYTDTFNEGDQEFDPSISAPGGLQQPRRGFGSVWRNQDNVRDALGWATGPEVPIDAARYEYDPNTGTHVLFGLSGERFELDDDGSWRFG